MKPVVVRNIKIGEGMPKICVPIVETTKEEIFRQAKLMEKVPADVIEWRADWFEDIFDLEKTKEVLVGLRTILKEMPILFTFRTLKEGGKRAIATNDYVALNREIVQMGIVDLIDVEVFMGEEAAAQIIAAAHQSKVKVIGSNHDFQKTPTQEEIRKRLCKMQELHADILKIAVMPQTKADVLTLLAATQEMSERYADVPIVTMSMSDIGMVSRLCGEVFGSALTFGCAEKASAPGQIAAEELLAVLEVFHKNLS